MLFNNMGMRKVDITIFGATGYTGKCVVEEFVNFNEKQRLSWAIAGRSKQKLSQVLKWASQKTGHDLSGIRIIIADCNDAESLDGMAKQSRTIINCCGPYSLYGEPVIEACLENSTHHVDVSGEPEFMERIQLRHHLRAVLKGVYIISACGLESVAADMGVMHAIKNFPGVVNSVEAYSEFRSQAFWEPGVNITTWASLVNGMTTIKELKAIREKLHPASDELNLEPRLEKRSIIHRSPLFNGKPCVWFLSPDSSVVQRSQERLYKLNKQRPVQFQSYLIAQPTLVILCMMVIAFFLLTLSSFAFGRKLLLRYAEVFTLGLVTKKGPSEAARARSFAIFRFVSEGWSKAVADQYESPELIKETTDTRMVTEMSFPDVGYGFTAKAVVLSAVTILKENKRLPLRGGVLTPGAAFAETNFLENLAEQGVSLKILSRP